MREWVDDYNPRLSFVLFPFRCCSSAFPLCPLWVILIGRHTRTIARDYLHAERSNNRPARAAAARAPRSGVSDQLGVLPLGADAEIDAPIHG